MTSLTIDNLCVSYGRKPALCGVSLAVPAGQITAVVGPSGCGKSSLLMCLNRLIDLVPSARCSGRVRLGDVDVLAPQVDVVVLRRRVGMIFQKPNPFPLSIRRNLELPLREHGARSRTEISARIERGLKDVGLWNEVHDRLDSPALTLSGGQQQRLCLARALVLEPEVLLLDEPCSALDPLAGSVVEELIAGFRGKLTVIVVTHNLAQARRIADYAAFFWLHEGAGRLIEHAPAAELFHTPRDPLTEAFLNGRTG